MKVLGGPCSSQHLVFSVVFGLAISGDCIVVSHHGFHFILLMTSDIEY